MGRQISALIRALTMLTVLVALGPRVPAAANIPPEPAAPREAGPLLPTVEPALLRALASDDGLPLRIIASVRAADVPTGETQILSRATLVGALQAGLDRALSPLVPLLDEAQRQGHLLERRDLWIIQSLALTAHPDLVRRLAASPAVAALRLDHVEQYVVPQDAAADESAVLSNATWGVAQVGAPQVWATLGISGTGSVVAVMDTGVEWLHPALEDNYRGSLGKGLVDHAIAWYDSVNGGRYPYDDHGHGTHVAGTAVGRATSTEDSIGVAPGARWIGVKVLSGAGFGYDSWIHAGFQWLLAPGGDPALAPDVVNNSWASANSAATTFTDDIERLRQAGIVALFAAGNAGPSAGSVGSPASNPGVFAVGASDADDDVALFSGRGPSPWHEIKPLIVAPGVDVVSSLPGGVYGTKNGTSMATPHVAGLVALLRSADAALTVDEIARVITQTAVPLSTTVPNNESGWGRIDAFAAVAAVMHPGFLTGGVTNLNKQALPGATVSAVPLRPVGFPAQTSAANNGAYTLALVPAAYDVTASAFGHLPLTHRSVDVLTDTHRLLDFTLAPLPTGSLRGRVTVNGTEAVPTGTVVVRVHGTPLTTTMDVTGSYAIKLPTGSYTVEVRGLGYRVARAPVTITAGMVTLHDVELTPVPTVLLVDEGAWYYGSQISYWQTALDALDVPYDTIRIKFPRADTPVTDTLMAYDVVLWSSPEGSPGLVGASDALASYLRQGGRLLLSGQDVAYFDGGGTFSFPVPQGYMSDTLGITYVSDNAASRQLSGMEPYAGLTVTIQGGDGADNQFAPDTVRMRSPDRSSHLWTYTGGGWGGVSTSVCVPFRTLFFSFGFEAIAGAETRRAVMARSLDWLAQSQPVAGLELTSVSTPVQIGLPGDRVTHTLRLRHTGYLGPHDAVTLTLGTSAWAVEVSPVTMTLSPCQPVTVTAVVTIPDGAAVNAQESFTLTATSTLTTTEAVIALLTKTPAPVLLVDDDRWYPMEGYYTTALAAAGIAFDTWDNADTLGGISGVRSPTAEIMARYPIIVWFTGYDWFAPVLPGEAALLVTYLDRGGRLLLSSQDFLYNNEGTPLARRLGVLSWDESLHPDQAFSVAEHPAGGMWGPATLAFPFNNWADTVEPEPGAMPVMRGHIAQPVGIATEGISRTLFYGIPLETLPFDIRTHTLAQGIGWLSPLGQSRWAITPTVPLPGGRVTSTVVLINDGTETRAATLSHTLPISLALVDGSLSPALHYEAGTRAISWAGPVAAGEPLTFTWAVSVTGEPGDILPLTTTVGLPEWGLTFGRHGALHVAGADLAASGWLSPEWSAVRAGSSMTLAFRLHNAGTGAIDAGSVRFWLTDASTPITATESPTRGWAITGWQGALAPASTVTLTVPVRAWAWDRPLRADAVVEDGAGQRWERRLWLTVEPWRFYLPVVTKP